MTRISPVLVTRILADVCVNLASGWLGVILISPGILGTASVGEYLKSLTFNLPLAILGIVVAYLLLDRNEFR